MKPSFLLYRRAAAIAIAVSVLLPATSWAQKRAITHEDVYLSKRLGAPSLSPDGKWVVFSVSEPAYDDKEQSSDLWIAAPDGSSPPRKLTGTKGGESGAVWSPDGSRIAFSARRDGDEASQIYIIDIGRAGEAQRVTSLSTGARAPRWRPDGKALLFTSDAYPGAKTDEENKKAAEERRKRKWNARVYDTFPIRDWDRWLDERRPSLFVQVLEPAGAAKDILAGSKLVAERGFSGQAGSGSDSIAAAWTPDGSGVVFVATRNRHEAAFAEVIQSLYLVSATGGEPKALTTDQHSYGSPTFSDDGKTLFAEMEPNTERVYNMSRLVRFAWPTMGAAVTLTTGWDRAIGSFSLADDGKSVYILAEDQGRQKVFLTSADTPGPVKEVGALKSGTYGSFDVEGNVAVANWESAINPPEVGRVDLATGKWSALTKFNAERAAAIDWQPLQEFWFTSKRGAKVHSFIALPPNFDPNRKYPLFVLLHGGPHSMWIDQFVIRWNYHLLAQPGYVVLLTNYTGSTGFGEKFAQNIQGDPLEGPANEVNEAADEAIKKFPYIDATRQAAGGASYGGHLANWLGVTTTRYKALISHAGLSDLAMQWGTSDVIYSRERNVGGPPWEGHALWTKQNPLSLAGRLKTPMLVTVGERDYRVPMNNAIQMYASLQRMKVPSRLVVFPDENHWILKGENSRFFYSEVHAWLAKWLSGT